MSRAALFVVLLTAVGGCRTAPTPNPDGPDDECYSLRGQPRPTLDEGPLEPLVGSPIWCGDHPDRQGPAWEPHRGSAWALPTPPQPGVCAVEFPFGPATRYRTDAAGRVVAVDSAGRRQTITWGDQHPLRYEAFRSTPSGEQLERRWIYDDQGFVVRTEQVGRVRVFQRRADGALLSEASTGFGRDAGFKITTWDPTSGAPIEEQSWSGAGHLQRVVRWRFDPQEGAFVSTQTGRPDHKCLGGEQVAADYWGRQDEEGRAVLLGLPERGYRIERAFDPEGRLLRERRGRVGEPKQDAFFAYDAAGRLTCVDRWYLNSEAIWTWPPWRGEGRLQPAGFCIGVCYFWDVVPHGGRARAWLSWSEQGHLTRMDLDTHADGEIDQVLEFKVEYDNRGRLVRQQRLGPWGIEELRYRYECGEETAP